MEDGRKDRGLAGVVEKMQPLVHGSEVPMRARREIPLDALTHCHRSPGTSLGLERILQSTKMLRSVLSGPDG